MKPLCQKKINSALIKLNVSLLPDIFGFFSVKQGCPNEHRLEELGSEIHLLSSGSWKKLARRLEINEGKITAIDHQEEELSEKAYKMLLHWKQVNGRGATYEVLFNALIDKLVNRPDLAQVYCCES